MLYFISTPPNKTGRETAESKVATDLFDGVGPVPLRLVHAAEASAPDHLLARDLLVRDVELREPEVLREQRVAVRLVFGAVRLRVRLVVGAVDHRRVVGVFVLGAAGLAAGIVASDRVALWVRGPVAKRVQLD